MIGNRSTRGNNQKQPLPTSGVASPGPVREESPPTVLTEEMHDLLFSEGDLVEAEVLEKFWGKYKQMATSPKQGSVLFLFKQPKVGHKEMGTFLTEVYLKRLGPIVIDHEVDLYTYFLYSLVLPHAHSVELAETVFQRSQAANVTSLDVLSAMTGVTMENRTDVFNLMRQVVRRFPKIMDFLIPKKVVVK